jgi:hypothetical protein
MTRMTFATSVLVTMVSTMTAEAQVYIRPVNYSESYSVTQQPLYVTTNEGYSAPATYAQQPVVIQQPAVVQPRLVQASYVQPTVMQPSVVQPTFVQQPVMVQQPVASYYAGNVCAQPVAYYHGGCAAQPCCVAQPCVARVACQPVAACEPVAAGCQPYYVRRGLLGQPKLYVPGQPIRNVLRALVP